MDDNTEVTMPVEGEEMPVEGAPEVAMPGEGESEDSAPVTPEVEEAA